jgi:hypothetical protein
MPTERLRSAKPLLRLDPSSGTLRELHYRVRVTAGPDAGRELELREPVVVGIAEACGLRLTDKSVSGRHVQLEPSGDGLLVRDLHSTNGTHLGAARIETALVVEPDATLRVGKTTLQVTVSEDAEVPGELPSFGPVIARSPAMRRLFGVLARVAASAAGATATAVPGGAAIGGAATSRAAAGLPAPRRTASTADSKKRCTFGAVSGGKRTPGSRRTAARKWSTASARRPRPNAHKPLQISMDASSLACFAAADASSNASRHSRNSNFRQWACAFATEAGVPGAADASEGHGRCVTSSAAISPGHTLAVTTRACWHAPPDALKNVRPHSSRHPGTPLPPGVALPQPRRSSYARAGPDLARLPLARSLLC